MKNTPVVMSLISHRIDACTMLNETKHGLHGVWSSTSSHQGCQPLSVFCIWVCSICQQQIEIFHIQRRNQIYFRTEKISCIWVCAVFYMKILQFNRYLLRSLKHTRICIRVYYVSYLYQEVYERRCSAGFLLPNATALLTTLWQDTTLRH